MYGIHAFMLGLGLLLPGAAGLSPPATADVAALREMLHDRQQPLGQSQAALLLVQSHTPEADAIVRQGLTQLETPDVFLALAGGVRLCRDARFNHELLAALGSNRMDIRQGVADTLAVLADGEVLRRLQVTAQDRQAELGARQAAVVALGRSGRKPAAATLLDLLSSRHDALRQSAVDALTELTGQTYGTDVVRWREWWEAHQGASTESWLEGRLVYQVGRARRLEGELEQARAQLVRLHQLLYTRLPVADRLSQVQALAQNEDATVRCLAVGWGVELLAGADAVGRRAVADTLLRLSHDAADEVQRAAVLALGRIDDPRDFGRLRELLTTGRPGVRAAAARALTQQATPSGPETARRARALRGEVVPALQKALDDPAWEVVVEAAEDLGSLGVPEAGPVLIALLHHPCEPVRQTAAQALERVADLTILDGLLTASTDSAVSVRFSLVGALGHAAADGRSLGDGQRARLVAGLEDLLLRDPDPAVRSRAATVLGACGTPDVLPVLWQRVLAAEDNRVQDKAWAAVINIIARTECLHLLNEWEHRLAEAGQVARRLELLGAVCDRWKKTERGRDMATPATEALVEAELEQKKWAAAFPLVRELLTRTGTKAELSRRLGWLLAVARQALHEGNRSESLRAAQEAQPFLAGHPELAAAFETLAKKARQGP